MNILDKIKRLKREIAESEAALSGLRRELAKTQDTTLRGIIENRISAIIDNVDTKRAELEELEKDMPERRPNGHHQPESLEDERLEIDYKPDDEDLSEN